MENLVTHLRDKEERGLMKTTVRRDSKSSNGGGGR